MKLYLIQNSKTSKTYFQFQNKREAEKKLREMNKGEQEICSPRGIEMPYRLEVDDCPFIVTEENGRDYFKYEYSKLSEAKRDSKIFYNEDKSSNFYYGIKDYTKSDGSIELSDSYFDFNYISKGGFYNE